MHYCCSQAVSQEADHLAITALTRALHVPLRIAYLDQSVLPYHDGGGLSSDLAAGGGGAGAAEVNFVEFEEEAAKKGEKGIEGALLYRESPHGLSRPCFHHYCRRLYRFRVVSSPALWHTESLRELPAGCQSHIDP